MLDSATDEEIQRQIATYVQSYAIFDQMRRLLHHDFTPDNPYSTILGTVLGYGNPYRDTHWVEEDGYQVEVADMVHSIDEAIKK